MDDRDVTAENASVDEILDLQNTDQAQQSPNHTNDLLESDRNASPLSLREPPSSPPLNTPNPPEQERIELDNDTDSSTEETPMLAGLRNRNTNGYYNRSGSPLLSPTDGSGRGHFDESLNIMDLREQKRYPSPLWVIWSLVFSSLLAALGTTCILYPKWRSWEITKDDVLGMYLGTTPLLFMQFALATPAISKLFFILTEKYVWVISIPVMVITACFIIVGAVCKRFSMLHTLYIFGTAVGSLGVLRQARAQKDTHFAELVVWLLLFMPINLKWVNTLYFPGNTAYSTVWFSTVATAIAVVGWKGLKGMKTFGYSIVPRSWKDGVVPVAAVIVIALIVLPIGAATGMIDFSKHRESVDPIAVACYLIEQMAAVSMLEEVLFRAVLFQRLEELAPTRRHWFAMVVSSAAYSLIRLPSVDGALEKIFSVGFSFISGCVFALAYVYTDNNILAPVLAHSIEPTCIIGRIHFIIAASDVDWVWLGSLQGAPDAPRLSLFGWLRPTLSSEEKALWALHGYFRFVRGVLALMLGYLAFALVILIPVDATGSRRYYPPDSPQRTTGTAIITIANLDPSNPSDVWRFYIHCASVVFNSALAYYILTKMYSNFVIFRQSEKSKPKPENFTIRVRNVRHDLPDEDLWSYLGSVFPGQIVSIQKTIDLSSLQQTEYYRSVYETLLEEAKARSTLTERAKMRAVPDILLPIENLICCAPKVDAIDHCEKKLRDIRMEIDDVVRRAMPTDIVYIVFNSIKSARMASQMLLGPRPLETWNVSPAPEPTDIIWEHHHIDDFTRWTRTLLSYLLSGIAILFWTVPVAFAVSIANMTALSKLPGLSWLANFVEKHPTLTGFIEGLLPAIIVFAFFEFLLVLLRSITQCEGHLSRSREDTAVLGKYYAFQIINIFLGSILAGTVFSILSQLVDLVLSPGEIVELLALHLPQQANFFVTYIAVNSIIRHLMALLRPVDLVLTIIRLKFAKSSRKRSELLQPPHFDYAYYIATDMLVFTVVTTYSSLAPLIILFGFIYFLFGMLSSHYNLSYVYKQTYQGVGKLWPAIYNRMMLSLLLYQLTLVGVFLLNSFIAGAVVCLILSGFTCFLWWHTHTRLYRRSKLATIDSLIAVNAPELEEDRNDLDGFSRDVCDAYIDPIIRNQTQSSILMEVGRYNTQLNMGVKRQPTKSPDKIAGLRLFWVLGIVVIVCSLCVGWLLSPSSKVRNSAFTLHKQIQGESIKE